MSSGAIDLGDSDIRTTSGTVTSVFLSVPTGFTISGNPISSGAGTWTLGLSTESANTVWAGPTSGAAAVPAFRTLVLADMPAGYGTGSVTSVAMTSPGVLYTNPISGSPITVSGTFALSLISQSQNSVCAAPSGSSGNPSFRALVASDIPSLSYVATVSVTAPITTTGGVTPTLGITQSTTSTDGYLSSTDWNTFNGKQNSPILTYTPNQYGLLTSGSAYTVTVSTPIASTVASLVSNGVSSSPTFQTLVDANFSAAAISNANLATMANQTFKGNNGGGASTPLDLSLAQFSALLTFSTLTIGSYGSNTSSNGLVISSGALNEFDATASIAGCANATTQTFAGDKSFVSSINLCNGSAARVAIIGNASSTAIHTQRGGFKCTKNTITASTYTVDSTTTDEVVFLDPTSNTITVTLPAPSNGRRLVFIDSTGKSGTNRITITHNASETINGLNSVFIGSNYNYVDLVSNGANWFIARMGLFIGARAHSCATSVASGTGPTTLVYSTVDYDSWNNYSNSTGVYTVAYPGRYAVTAAYTANATNGNSDTISLNILKNASIQGQYTIFPFRNTSPQTVGFRVITDVLACAIGDTLAVQANGSTTLTVNNTTTENYISFTRIGD